jgi:hypothetical protein
LPGDSGALDEATSSDDSSGEEDGSVVTTATMFLTNSISGAVYRYGIASGVAPVLNDTISGIPSGSAAYGQTTATGAAMSPAGELFVADLRDNSIYRFLSPLGTPTPNGTITGAGLSNPEEMRFVDDQLWIPNLVATSCSTSPENVVQVSFDAQGRASAISTPLAGSVASNRGMLWVPATRDFYESACSPANSVQHYTVASDETVTALAPITGNGLNNPSGMAMAPWGELFVVNSGTSQLLRFTANGTIVDPSFNNPIGIAFTPWGELYVVNQGSGTLSRFGFDSSHTATLVGSSSLQGPGAGNPSYFDWILIAPGASTSLITDGGVNDGALISDGAPE